MNIGVLLGVDWRAALAFCGIWLLVALLTRYSSLSALIAALITPIGLFAFADHATRTRFADLPSEAVRAAKIFMLDTLGVGIVGSSGPMAGDLAEAQEAWGQASAARVART